MTRVYTCLVGDLFHVGHVNFLRQSKAEGDYLLVGVCSDEDCKLYKRETVMTLKERVVVIEACKYVDEIIERPPSVINQEFMDEHKIDLIVHGDDSNTEQLLYFYGPAIRQGKYKSLPYTKGISTTDVIERITKRSSEDLRRRYFLG